MARVPKDGRFGGHLQFGVTTTTWSQRDKHMAAIIPGNPGSCTAVLLLRTNPLHSLPGSFFKS